MNHSNPLLEPISEFSTPRQCYECLRYYGRNPAGTQQAVYWKRHTDLKGGIDVTSAVPVCEGHAKTPHPHALGKAA